ncbi:MAG TPA: hypothetical protein PLR18_03415 [bacterium]|nr:hypothetical protein [bacterium]
MKLTKKNLAIGGILASIVLLFINNTESGEALAENIRTRYELATRRARNRLRVFGIFEAIMLIAALISFRAGMWEQGCWLVFFLLLPFLASMFFIRAAFPSSEGVIKGIAIPIFMLLDVLLVAILALNPGEVTYATLALSYLMIIKLGSDLGMITGIFTNRPYILTFWSAILVLILGLGLRLSAYDVEIVNHLNSRKRDNLKGTIQMVTVTHDINPYRLTENEITEIVQEGYDGGRAKLNRFIGWKTVDTTITAGTTLAVCKWVQPVISMSGVTNVVVITAGPNGDFNLAGSDSKELAGQMFLVPLGYTSEGGDYQQPRKKVEQDSQKSALASAPPPPMAVIPMAPTEQSMPRLTKTGDRLVVVNAGLRDFLFARVDSLGRSVQTFTISPAITRFDRPAMGPNGISVDFRSLNGQGLAIKDSAGVFYVN